MGIVIHMYHSALCDDLVRHFFDRPDRQYHEHEKITAPKQLAQVKRLFF